MDEAGLMGNFVRLADMMLAEALLSHVVDTVKELLEVLQASENVPVDAAKVAACIGHEHDGMHPSFSKGDAAILLDEPQKCQVVPL